VSTVRATNFQHASAANPAIVLAADGSATANVSSINNGPLAGMRNAIINGNFDIWQRGTSHSTNGYGSADRWSNSVGGSSCTMSRQPFTLGQTDVPGEPTYFCRMAVTSVAGAASVSVLNQNIEDVRTFAGQQITVSFWAKADAAKPIAVEFIQKFGFGGSPSSEVNAIGVTKITLSTAWQKVTVTATIPSLSGKTLGTNGDSAFTLNIWFDAGSDFNARTDTLGQQSGTFDIAQVQVEPGPVATPFERRPVGTELALCQRYYLQTTQTIGVEGLAMAGQVIAYCQQYVFPSTMRVAPTCTTNGFNDGGNMNGNTITDISPQSVSLRGLTFSGVITTPSKATGFWAAGIQFSAEL
jgi:hypothetical protein